MLSNQQLSAWCIYFMMTTSLISFSQTLFPFIENKGQLPAHVKSKIKLPGGAIFIEKNGFKYVFYNQHQIQNRH